jgi:hypothetical protein
MPDLIRHPDVVPTKVGNHLNTGSRFPPGTLDSGFRRNDDLFGNRFVYGQTLNTKAFFKSKTLSFGFHLNFELRNLTFHFAECPSIYSIALSSL